MNGKILRLSVKKKRNLILRKLSLAFFLSLFAVISGRGQALSIQGSWKLENSDSKKKCIAQFEIIIQNRTAEIKISPDEIWTLSESENWATEEGTRYIFWRDYPLVLEVFEEQRVSKPEFESKSIRFERTQNGLLVTFKTTAQFNSQETTCQYSSF